MLTYEKRLTETKMRSLYEVSGDIKMEQYIHIDILLYKRDMTIVLD